MKGFLKVAFGPVVLGSLGIAALCALVWWVGPLVAIGDARPLGGTTARALLVALLALGWVGRLAYAAWRRRRAHAELLGGLMASDATTIDREGEQLAARFREAVDKLKTAHGARHGRFGSGDPLQRLPWYVFVGAPGSGKTTALLNAGLDFVPGDDGAAVRGVGGTRNCDWWFTRDAVLIDTAGRYALQESDREVDAAGWQRFLALLRRTRPRRPINGVLLTVSVQDLLQRDDAARQAHAAELRARLQELQARLGVRPPVYALVTKTDLVAGFAETFDAFGKEERDQVWGVTFPADGSPSEQPLRDFGAQFDRLVERLSGSLVERLQQERDVPRRAAIFGFVQEFAALGGVLGEFLGRVFDPAAASHERVNLRGVYFTSGTQEGTPIDRVLGQLSRSFGLQARPSAREPQRGKSFFLRRLLQEVVFGEAHLVSHNAQAERRRRLARTAGFAAVGVAALALLAGWVVSYSRNTALGDEVAARLPALQRSVDALPPATGGDVLPVVPVLTAAERAAQPAGAAAATAPPLLSTLGLHQGDKLDAAAEQGYRNLLRHALAPRVARRLEERLRATGKEDLEQAYEALKAYLMLYTPGQFDASALKAWIGLDWDTQFRNLGAAERAQLDHHLDELLALGAFDEAVVARLPMDRALVAGAREMLSSFPLEYRVYSRLRRQQRGDLPEFTVAGAAGPSAAQVFERTSREPLSRGVPGFYTRAGHAAFRTALPKAAAQLAGEESWVLGRGGADRADTLRAAAAAAADGGLADRVLRLYLQDYIKTWDTFLADVRLVRLGGLDRSLEIARTLASPDSPLAAYLRAVARETSLVPPAREPGALDKAAAAAGGAKDDLRKLAGAQPAPGAAGGPPERMVDDHFAPIHRLVQGQPPPIDGVLTLFGDVYAQLKAVDEARKSKSAPPPAAGGAKVKVAAAQQPEPVRSMLDALADAGASQGRVAERDANTSELKPVHDFCMRAVANRYPFASGSRADVLPEDFGQLFAPGGMLDEFYQRRLAALVDTGTTPWTYKPLADGQRPASPAALADFQRAARIREAFFRGGSKAPGFRLDIRALDLGADAKELVLDVDGQLHRFAPGSTAPATIAWPGTRVASQVRLLVSPDAEPLVFEGPWALFRMFDRFEVRQPSPRQPERFEVLIPLDGRRVRLEVTASSVLNPFRMREIQQFRCPGAL